MPNEKISRIQLPDGTEHAIRSSLIPYGEVDSTSTATVYTATVDGISELSDGTIVLLKNGVITSASGFTININNLGAKPVYNNLTTGHGDTAPTRETTIFNINYTMMFIYSEDIVDGGGWICLRGYDANTNTIGYQLRTNSSNMVASDTGYKYRLWLTQADGKKWVPINTSTSTNSTTARTLNTRPIDPFGPIVYRATNGTCEAGVGLGATGIWQQYTCTIGYSYVITMTAQQPLYLKCAPQANGSAVMESLTQTLPTSNDGKIYIFLGVGYSTTALELQPVHPVYYHDGNGIKLWTGTVIPTKTSDLTNDSGFITGYTETDPVFSASAAAGITSTDISNWNSKVSDDHKWNDVSLSKNTTTATSDLYIPCMDSISTTTAELIPAYDLATVGRSIVRRTVDGYIKAATPSSSDNSNFVATTEYVTTAIANLPEPMLFKGSVGTGGTVTSLPTAAAANEGWTYKVITALSSPAAKVGDTVISNGSEWIVIPSGDEPSGTVTSVGVSNATNGGLTVSGSPVTSSGTITIGHSNVLSSAQTTQAVYPIKIDKNGHISAYGSAVTIPVVPSNIVNTITTTAGAHTTISSSKGDVSFKVPTKTSHLTNDSGFITSYTDEKVKAVSRALDNSDYYLIFGSDSGTAETKQYNSNLRLKLDSTNNAIILNLGSSSIAGRVVLFGGNGASDKTITLKTATVTAARTITLPDKTGTVALTSDVPSVPSWALQSTKPSYTASEVGAQPTLVSGTNIKTINNESLLGSGNLTIDSGAEHIALTQAEFDALTPAQKADSTKIYFITDGSSSGSSDDSEKNIFYGVCTTAANTQAKEVTVDSSFSLEEGVIVILIFQNHQYYNGAPTLNVNSTGAITIKRYGTTNAARYEWAAGDVLGFIYNGTNWVSIGVTRGLADNLISNAISSGNFLETGSYLGDIDGTPFYQGDSISTYFNIIRSVSTSINHASFASNNSLRLGFNYNSCSWEFEHVIGVSIRLIADDSANYLNSIILTPTVTIPPNDGNYHADTSNANSEEVIINGDAYNALISQYYDYYNTIGETPPYADLEYDPSSLGYMEAIIYVQGIERGIHNE